MVNFKGDKIAFVSDIHLGVHQDSQVWHDISITFAEWLNATLIQEGIRDIIIAGDIFHDRHEIGVNTIHAAYRFFDILKDYNIVAITGNHDCFYKDKSDVNSISILGNRKNITVFQDIKTFKVNDKVFTFCPWGTTLEEIPKSDVIVGHFEIINFKLNHYTVCEHGLDSGNLLDKGDLIITGHFHFRDHRKYANNKSILYLGCPYELNFSDIDQSKGITILDTDTLDLKFIENTVTPKHKKIKITDLLNGNIKPDHLTNLIGNNFINLNVDKKVDTQTLDLILAKFTQQKPKNVRTEFNIFEQVQLSATEIEEFSFDVETALSEFVELLDTQVSKKDILNKCIDFYRISQNANR